MGNGSLFHRFGAAAALSLTLAYAPFAVAQNVGTAKPSDIVVALRTTFDDCSAGSGGRVATRLGPDGSLQPFAIPAGVAFLVTGAGLASTMGPGGSARFILRADGSGIVVGEGTIVNVGSAGAPVVGHVTFPSPIRFTTHSPCVLLDGDLANTRFWLYGFLVKDQ